MTTRESRKAFTDFLVNEKGLDLDAPVDGYKRTLLMLAAKEGKYDLCLALLEAGVNVNIAPNADSKDTALHWATTMAQVEITKLLVDFGADPNLMNRMGTTPKDFISDLSRPRINWGVHERANMLEYIASRRNGSRP